MHWRKFGKATVEDGPEYQDFPTAYGYLRSERNGKGRHIVAGWAVNLPGFRGFDFNLHTAAYFAQRVELMAHFATACKHPWFRNCMRHLESYRTAEGRYRFPRRYLQERPQGYWVFGAHMGLEPDRRPRRAIELESTFRMLKIQQLMSGA